MAPEFNFQVGQGQGKNPSGFLCLPSNQHRAWQRRALNSAVIQFYWSNECTACEQVTETEYSAC